MKTRICFMKAAIRFTKSGFRFAQLHRQLTDILADPEL
jgi:hypothetical protein